MQRLTWRIGVTLAIVGVLATWRASPAAQQAAGSGQNPDTLAALLVEVRGLRAAMEQMASAGPRVQLAMGRLQLQEQRINTLMRQVDGIRNELAGRQRQEREMSQQLASFDEPGGKWRDNPDERHAVEQQVRMMKA